MDTASDLKFTARKRYDSSIVNPRTVGHIHELVKAVEASKPEEVAEAIEANKDNHRELELLLFAQDILIRKITRQIQEERVKARQLMEQDAADKRYHDDLIVADAEGDDAVVTVADVMEKAEEHMRDILATFNKEAEAEERYARMVVGHKELQRMTFDSVTGNRYTKTFLSLQALNKEHKENRIQLDTATDFDTYKAIKDREVTVQKERQLLAKELLVMRRVIHKNKPTIMATFNELQQQNKEFAKQLQVHRHAKNIAGSRYETLSKLMERLYEKDPNQVVADKAVHRAVTRKDKLYGTIPLQKLPRYRYYTPGTGVAEKKLEEFIVIGKNKVDPKLDIPQQVMAIRIGDPIVNGKVPVYNISLMAHKRTQGGRYMRILDVRQTSRTANLYKEKESFRTQKTAHTERVLSGKPKRIPASKVNFSPVIITHDQPKVEGRLVQKVANAIKDPRARDVSRDNIATGRTQNLWHDQEESTQTEMQRTEEKLKQGWSL